MNVVKTSFEKNPFIGIFLRASDELLLIPKDAHEKLVKLATAALGVDALHLFVNQSHLLGLYTVLNSKGCVLPETAEREEVTLLKKAGLNVCQLPNRFAAVGNNVVATDKAVLVNPLVEKKECREIGDCLGVEVFRFKIGGFTTIGAMVVATNNGFLASNEASDRDLEELEKCFRVKGTRGSSNQGVPFNSISIVANSKGVIIGELTTGFESSRIHEAFE